jgi:hypothetical protein
VIQNYIYQDLLWNNTIIFVEKSITTARGGGLLKENIFLYFLAQRQSRFAKGAGFSRSNHHQRWWLTNKSSQKRYR